LVVSFTQQKHNLKGFTVKIIFLTLLTIISTDLMSASITTTSKKIHKSTTKKDGSFSLEFLIATEQTKEIVSKKMDGSYTKFDTSLLQHLNKNNEIRYFLSTRYIDTKVQDGSDFGNEFETFFYELMYRRKNILTESENGLYMEAELKNYRILDKEIKKRYGFDGAIIPQVILKKNFNRSLSAKIKVRRHFYQTNNDGHYTLDAEDRIYLSLAKVFKHRFMLMAQMKYQHKIRKGNGLDYRFMELAEFGRFGPDFSKVPEAKKHQEITTLHTGLTYFLNRSSMVELYGETQVSNNYDKRDLETITNDEFVLGTALYLTAF
jgi:hypothetical protein